MAVQGTVSPLDSKVTEAQMDPIEKVPTISEVFNGKKVLITGATGFVGKVLLEKLLRSCPGISEVIVIIHGDTVDDHKTKLSKLMNHKVFDRLKEECPDALSKVRAINGEITLINLGIEPSNLETIWKEISFVFHCAANVRFDCIPESTLGINLKGVKQLLRLCKEMSNLKAVVHVSTAFSFCNQPIIGEEVYPERIGPNTVLDALAWMKHDQLKHFAEYLKEGRPSLYHASKALAEILIAEERDHLPIVIVRPSIITAAMKEPFPGWIDNYNGPSGFIALSSKGILKTLLVNENVNADWVPVDIVANTLIAAAHFMAVKGNLGGLSQLDSTKVPIFNCVCPEENRTTWSNIVDICLPILYKYPSATVYCMPGGVVTSSKTVHTICKYLFHYLPAFLLDLVCFCVWRDLGLIHTYTRIHNVMNHLQVYTTRQFYFTSRNMKSLNRVMCPEDQRVFPIDQSCLDWPLYMQDYVLGVRRYFLKENDDSLPAARRRLKMLKVFHYGSILVVSGTILHLFVKRFSTGPNSFSLQHATTQLFKYCYHFLPNSSNEFGCN